MRGYSDVLIGLQYGDEGKARIIDNIASNYDIIARFNGGPNAGHTVEVNNKRVALHQVPSGIFHPDMLLYIGSGCVLNLEKLINEINEIKNLGIGLDGRLIISEQATVILPGHIELDKIIGAEIGSTGNGIGPAYADRALRCWNKKLRNLRFGDFIDDPKLARKTIIENWLDYSDDKLMNPYSIADKLMNFAKELKKYACKNPLWIDSLARGGKKILFEGAQASLLDVAKGTVPYVTSSYTMSGAAYVGGDLSPNYHRKTIGVAKAIMSRVGNGPFVSEYGCERSEKYCMEDGGKKHNAQFEKSNYSIDVLLKSNDLFDIGIALRMLGNEYGATTKRPRRIGILDLVSLAHNCKQNGVDEIYMNKIDCLVDFAKTNLSGIPLVVEYELNGQKINYLPSTTNAQRKTNAIAGYLPKMINGISNCQSYSELPDEAKKIVEKIEAFTECKVAGVGVGPKREQFILI